MQECIRMEYVYGKSNYQGVSRLTDLTKAYGFIDW